jgi:hypothetical protein
MTMELCQVRKRIRSAEYRTIEHLIEFPRTLSGELIAFWGLNGLNRHTVPPSSQPYKQSRRILTALPAPVSPSSKSATWTRGYLGGMEAPIKLILPAGDNFLTFDWLYAPCNRRVTFYYTNPFSAAVPILSFPSPTTHAKTRRYLKVFLRPPLQDIRPTPFIP